MSVLVLLVVLLGTAAAEAQAPQPQKPPEPVQQQDPFADLAEAPHRMEPAPQRQSWWSRFFKENLGFRKEVMLEPSVDGRGNPGGLESVGFEVLKKFSTDTATVAAVDFQGRFVRRDGSNMVSNDMMSNGAGWAFEYHNLYVDLYNVFNPLLTEQQRGEQVGRFNFRAGRFYVPFGLNLQTDTHGTVLQLSNERNFGFERDWYTGFWGRLNKHFNYDLYYLTGSGYGLKWKGQSGLGALRVSLANSYGAKYGLEGGVSILGGERLSSNGKVIDTKRGGVDGRYRRAVPNGLFTWTTEWSLGRDQRVPLTMQLHQAEYLHQSRRWGLSSQYRRYASRAAAVDASVFGEVAWYLRNDVGSSNLHSIRLNVERQLERMEGRRATVVTLQYYFYR